MNTPPRGWLRRAGAGAALAAAILTATAGTTGPAAAAPTGLTAASFRLTPQPDDSTVGALDAVLPPATVPQVLASANRTATTCSAHAPSVVAAFCWQSSSTDSSLDDEGGTNWYPQAITTSADADPSGSYQGKQVILAGWYWHAGGTERGDRIAFVDYTNPAKPVYRFVLLVEPGLTSGGQPTFGPVLGSDGVSMHAGGMFWYGHYLYVADTWGGFRVFDLDHLWKVDTSGASTAVGRQSDGTYQAYNYAYVLPQVTRYAASTAGGYPAERFSAVELDRTGASPSVVVPEYNTASTDTHRVVRYPLDAGTFRFAPSTSDGLVHATEAYETGIPQMQGAASVRGRFYGSTSHSTSSAHYGTLYSFTRAQSVRGYPDVLQPYPEDLSYWGPKDQLWSLSEDPGQRAVYAMKESALAWPAVASGATGAVVTTVQYLLDQAGAKLSVDGDFGAATLAAVKSFQSGHGLSADGVVGPNTWARLRVTVQSGSTGDAVRAAQAELTAHGTSTPVTGTFDATTATNLRAFQTASGLPVTGTTDLDTWRDLVN
jgi:hypothetical protein